MSVLECWPREKNQCHRGWYVYLFVRFASQKSRMLGMAMDP